MESSTKGKAKRRHLNSTECAEMSRGLEGSQPLTLPHHVSYMRSISDPNKRWYPRWYPRTPKKRRNAELSKDERQPDITQFFPSSGVVKVVSPKKAAMSQASCSIKSHGLNGELIPKREPFEEDEEVLATPIKEEPEEEDYLEGMTTDMFGDDAEFERCASDQACTNCPEEEEVEALPDAHYGLLGSSRDLAQPQGHVDHLPEEVLSLVLSLLPADDLYCHISLVCHRWRNIVAQPLFVPWKKLYYRYTRKERTALKEINGILETHRIVKKDPECVLHLVEFMAQFKPIQRVKPEAVSLSLKRHRLFTQAEACIKHRLPKLWGIEGVCNAMGW
ncbi:hypothetical protein DPEC_G00112560 [Dallia pectoralis]|uniref:Uncharacterized protein n=1 Tax=Dallia pectoralis TaxID=75939 RepID=A0ACC2GTI8_DALPE|nr:hypothetical protein DPEC_G00112560 [Dallia pectoralis]